MKNKPTSFTLKLDSPHIPSEKFIKGAKAFFELLEEMTSTLFDTKKAISWYVQVSQGCAQIEALPKPTSKAIKNSLLVKKVTFEGLRMIKGGKERPAGFSDAALEKVRTLADLADPNGLTVSLISGHNKRIISPEVGANASKFLSWTHSAIGTIEGQLRALAMRNDEFQIEIRDEVSGQPVRCQIPEELLEEAKGAFARRVSVTGVIRYRANRIPISIEVERLFRFPWSRELPNHHDVRGIYGGAN